MAVAEEAAYQTGLDTSGLMCLPITRHAAHVTITRGDNQEMKQPDASPICIWRYFCGGFFWFFLQAEHKESCSFICGLDLTTDNGAVGAA